MEKLVYVLWAAVAALVATVMFFVFGLYSYAYERGVEATRAELQDAAEACTATVSFGIREWQQTVGVPITHRVQCQPLYNVAAGRPSYDDGTKETKR